MNKHTLAVAANAFFRYPYDISIAYVVNSDYLYAYYVHSSYFTYFEIPGMGFQRMIWTKPANKFFIDYHSSTIFANNAAKANVMAFKLVNYLKSLICHYNESHYIRFEVSSNELVVRDDTISNSHEHPQIKKFFEEYEEWENNKLPKKPTQAVQYEEKQQMTLYDSYRRIIFLLLNAEVEVFLSVTAEYKKIVSCKYIEEAPSSITKHSQCIEVTTSDGNTYVYSSVDSIKNRFYSIVKPVYNTIDFE